MKRIYKIVKVDGPRDEFEATFIPHVFAVKVKGNLRWHTVKQYQDFDEEFAKSECEALVEKLQESGGPVETQEAKAERIAKYNEYVEAGKMDERLLIHDLFDAHDKPAV